MSSSADPAGRPPPPSLHHDPLAGRLVFVAPQRAERPNDADLAGAGVTTDPGTWCPFCAGNEHRTPPAVLRAPADPSRPWHARIVPNRYPIATEASVDRRAGSTGAVPSMSRPQPGSAATGGVRPARGVHDVVIESAGHVASILGVPATEWRDVWHLCRSRLAMLAARGDLAWATVFKNSGPAAGASLEHVHSQLVGLDFVPPLVRAELAAAAADRSGFERLLDDASGTGRLVAECGGLVALTPPAPRQPFETWIVPTTAAPHFHDADPEQVAALADLTRLFVERLGRVAAAADYNWWLHQAPFTTDEVAGWHWHLEVVPRITSLAGFELGTGCHITTLSPADAAGMLRGG